MNQFELTQSNRAMRSVATAIWDLFDHSSDCFIETDEQGVIRRANKAAIALFGIAAADLIGTVVKMPIDTWLPMPQSGLHFGDPSHQPELRPRVTITLPNGRVFEATSIVTDDDGGGSSLRCLLVHAATSTFNIDLRSSFNERGYGSIPMHQRMALLAEASRAFTEASLDLDAVMEIVTRSISTYVGDTCVIRLLSEDGVWLHPVAVYHCDSDARDLARAHNANASQRAASGAAGIVVRSGKALLVPHVDQRELRASAHPDYIAYLDKVGVTSLIMVPLRVRGKVIGTLGVARDHGGEPYTYEDQTLVQELADRAALAVENARLYGVMQAELAERKRAEERYRLVTQATSDAVWDWDLNEKLLWRSASLQTLFGYRPDEVASEVAWWYDHIHPDDRERVIQSVREVIDGDGDHWAAEYRFLKSDGAYAYILDTAQVLRDEDGKPVRMIGAMSDVTQQKETEMALRLSEEKYRTLIEHSPDVTWSADAGGNVIFISPNAERVLGYSAEEIRRGGRKLWQKIVHPDDFGELARSYRRLFREKKPYSLEYRLRRGDGKEIWILDRSSAPYERDGVICAEGVYSDITEQKRAAANLQLFRTFVNQSNDALTVIDAPTGRIIDVNDIGCSRLGYTREEMLSMRIPDIDAAIGDHQIWRERYEAVRKAGSAIVEGVHRRKDGTSFPVEVNIRYIVIDKREYFVAVERDITERKRAEEALRHAHDILVKRVEERTAEVMDLMQRMEDTRTSQQRFVADASHDLRTPLTIVRAELDLLRLRPEHDHRTRESLDRIHAESKRLDQLANDLLLLATLDSLSPDDTTQVAQLEELVIDAVSDLSLLSREKNIIWNIEIEDSTEIRCAKPMVRRALMNLLENAIEHSDPGGIIRIGVKSRDNRVLLEIEDDGCGIAPENIGHVFDRFYRTDVARNTSGTGLGLAIVKSVMDAHDGDVAIESHVGKGTLVRLFFPL